jgi:DNA-binding XRE family transcriptional regulator
MKYNKAIVQKITTALENGIGKTYAAEAAGISFQTFCNWEKGKVEFFEAVKKAMDIGMQVNLDRCEQRIINDKSWQSAAWWLERNYPERFGGHNKLNVAYEKPLIVVADEHTKELIEKLGDGNWST